MNYFGQGRVRATSCFGLLSLPVLLIGLQLTPAAWAVAQSSTPLLDASLEQLLGVEVTSVSRLAQPLSEAPAAVTVIDRQTIRASGAWDLADLFRLVPGMYVAYNTGDTYSSTSTVSFHGITDAYARRMQVLVDGRTVYSPLFGGALWSDIPLALDDIERIEVIRGPNSASYGANSFLGVINIITRHSGEEQGTALATTLGAGRDEVQARFGGRRGDLSYRVTVSARNDDGEDANIARPIDPSPGWSRNKYDDKRIRMMSARLDYQLNAIDSLELQFGYNGGKRQTGTDVDTFLPHWETASSTFELARWIRHLEADNELTIQAFHSYEGTSDEWTFRPRPNAPGPLNADVAAHRYDVELQHTLVPFERARLVWGAGLRLDRTSWPLFLAQDSIDFRLARLFGNLEWRPVSELVLNAGAMLENNSFTGTDVTPRMAANWHLTPNHTLRASYSLATRTPSLFEEKVDFHVRASSGLPPGLPAQAEYLLFSAQGGLKPERIRSAELGYLGKTAALELDLRLFYDRMHDLISFYDDNPCPAGRFALYAPGVLCVGDSARGSHNAGRLSSRGVEGQLVWRIDERTRLDYGFAHVRIASADQDAVSYSQSMPENSQRLSLSHRFDHGWDASLTGFQLGKDHMPGSGSAFNGVAYVAGHRRLDARLAYRFKGGGASNEIALMVQNLADARYFEFSNSNEVPGRKAMLTAKTEF